MGRWISGWVVVALAIAIAGCGGGDGDADKTPTPGQSQGDASAEASATPDAPAEAEPIVEALGSIDGGRARFLVTELRRSGPTVILNARLELVDPTSERLQVGSTFDDGDFQDLEDGGTEPGDVFDGVALIDPEGKKKYFVARDDTNRCVCSNELSAAFIREEAPVELTATLAAPPPDVSEVDLVVPRFGTLHDVALAQ